MPIVKNVNELQNILKGWMQRPNESVEEWRKRFEEAVPIDVMADHMMQVLDKKDTDAIDVILVDAHKQDNDDVG